MANETMMDGLKNSFKNLFHPDKKTSAAAKDEAARILGTSPEALAAFEEAYRVRVLENTELSDDLFQRNAKQAAAMRDHSDIGDYQIDDLVHRIVEELVVQTAVYSYDGKEVTITQPKALPGSETVTVEEINALPKHLQPELAGTLIKRDFDVDNYPLLLIVYKRYLETTDPKKKATAYGIFRQGLDMQDLDPVLYEMLGMNPNSMGHWLPALVEACRDQEFFHIPKTTIIKVPLTMLQLTRLEYESLTPTTMRIIDEYCQKVFGLDEAKDYFIKTGTYSSKYEFRNAHVHGAKEVRELGEYLLFIQHQAVEMASPFCQPVIYGVSTTNEWVVREYIPAPDDIPCIYNGLPLRCEFRAFLDFDADDPVMGVFPYWDPDTMKKRFGHCEDSNEPEKVHDYIIYRMREPSLMKEFHSNKALVEEHLRELLPKVNLSGQWSLDIMKSGDTFYLIDMALAKDSALREKLPQGAIREVEENWIPELPEPNGT